MPRSPLKQPGESNILLNSLGPMLSPEQASRAMYFVPPIPTDIADVPRHERLLHLLDVRDFHFPPKPEIQLQQTVYSMAWQTYKHKDPMSPSTWAAIGGESKHQGMILPSPIAASVEGLSGVGKTQACLRSLRCFPSQTVRHTTFPMLVGEHQQIVWLSVEVPPSGKSADLARALMQAWKQATGSERFEGWLKRERMYDGMRALDEWRQVAVSHFLGILHLDEVQNLFKLSSLQRRRTARGTDVPELSIVEDQLLRWLLYLTNSGQLALLFSGTPDGIGALTKRLSTLQRINVGGYHAIEPIRYDPAKPLAGTFLGQLGLYQYVKHPLAMDGKLAELIMDLTAGIQRVVIALWVAAHRVALERKDDTLKLEDFTVAAATWLKPLTPAITALRKGDAARLARYEDLIPRDTTFWASFWSGASS